MCQDSLIYYLENHLNGKVTKDQLEEFIYFADLFLDHEKTATSKEEKIKNGEIQSTKYTHKLPKSIIDNAKEIDDLLENIKICDPAVGSGAFLIGMMHEIIKLRTLLSYYLGKKELNTYKLKRYIIENSLYGVDIDAGAVEICMLRFWLSLIVDESDFKNIRPLPNLDYKIMRGDSLSRIEENLFNTEAFNKLESLKLKYFNTNNSEEKKELKKEIDNLIFQISKGHTEFDFKVYFSEIFYKKNGFDIVIANPPYGVKIKDDIKNWYGLGSKDSYGVFILMILKRLLKPGGVFSCIVSDTWLTIKTHRKLREQVLEKQLKKVIRLHQDCFDATVNACTISLINSPNENNKIIVADFTNISTRKEIEELKAKFYNLKHFIGQATTKFAVYEYNQDLIKTNSNLPIFVGSPKLFALMNDTNCETEEKEIAGKKVKVRKIKFNDKIIELVRFGDIAEVKVGLQTGDNQFYLFKNPQARGSYRSIENYKEYLLTEKDLEKIANNEELRLKIIEKGFHKSRNEKDFDEDLWFDGRYIVPYDKGGESDTESGWLPNYYVPTQYYIDWSQEAIKRMKTLTIGERDGTDRDKVASRFQNSEFYFKKGITFSHTGQYSPTFRIASIGPFDVGGSDIFCDLFDVNFQLGILNSKILRLFWRVFIDHTVNVQVDEAKELSFIIYENKEIENLALSIINKQKQNPRYDYMSNEQKEIDKLVYEMYGLNKDDIREVETWYARRYPKLARFCDIN